MDNMLEVLFNEIMISENLLSNELLESSSYKEVIAEYISLEKRLFSMLEDKEAVKAYDIKKQDLSYLKELIIFKVAFKMGGKFILGLVHDKEEKIV